MRYQKFRYRVDGFKDWLFKTVIILAVELIFFSLAMLAGMIIELPLRISDSSQWHQIWDFVAALLFLLALKLGWDSWHQLNDMIDFKGQYTGVTFVAAAAIPLGYMLTYQSRSSGQTQVILFDSFFYGSLLVMSLGMILILLTPLYYSSCWKRIRHARR